MKQQFLPAGAFGAWSNPLTPTRGLKRSNPATPVAGGTGHTEAVRITFDSSVVSYADLVEIYWQQTDPADAFGQFQDRGDNYRPVIFVKDEEQRAIAQASKDALANSGRFTDPIVTTIEDAQPFYVAEDYHQDFYKKDPERMKLEEAGGREQFIEENWQ